MSLGMGGSPNLIQVDPANLRDFQPHPKPERDPIAQRFPQFTLAAGQGLMFGPDSLQSWYLAPVGGILLDDFVSGQLHRNIKKVCKHANNLNQAGQGSRRKAKAEKLKAGLGGQRPEVGGHKACLYHDPLTANRGTPLYRLLPRPYYNTMNDALMADPYGLNRRAAAYRGAKTP